jgi:hypothetical protein
MSRYWSPLSVFVMFLLLLCSAWLGFAGRAMAGKSRENETATAIAAAKIKRVGVVVVVMIV